MAQRGRNGRREPIPKKSLFNIRQETLTLDEFISRIQYAIKSFRHL